MVLVRKLSHTTCVRPRSQHTVELSLGGSVPKPLLKESEGVNKSVVTSY